MKIFDFAVVDDWVGLLRSLAELAEAERWDYVSVPSDRPLPILDSYVRFTFRRVHGQRRVAKTSKHACFNTGLLTPSLEEIFGIFILSEGHDPGRPPDRNNKRWILNGWVRRSDPQLMSFQSLPGLATYWEDPAVLVFDPSLEVELNIDHIIRDNLTRFPISLGGRVRDDGVPEDLTEMNDEDEISLEADASDTPNTKPSNLVPLATRNALDGAIAHSLRLARRSYRIAVPQFYRGKIQLLLPLYLRDSHRADLALTLQRHHDRYRAATVLYPDWAYRHARLLTRPNSEWLGGFRSDLSMTGLHK